MKPFFALLGLSFKTLIISTANIGRSRGKRKQAATGIGALVLLSGICLYLSGMYSFMLGQAAKACFSCMGSSPSRIAARFLKALSRACSAVMAG